MNTQQAGKQEAEMYLVVKQIKGKGVDRQIPLRTYQNYKNAVTFMQNYIADSSYNWTSGHSNEKDRVYCRKLKNGKWERLNIRYMKLY